jgi:hypothetical protein
MPIPIICPCSAKLRVNDRLKGQYIQCPKCGSVHPVGGANGSPAAPPAGPPAAPAAVQRAAAPAPPPPADTAAALSQSDLTQSDRALLEQQLKAGERVVWAGKPSERLAFLTGLVATGFLGIFGLVLLIVVVILLASGAMGIVGGLILGLVVAAFLGAGGAWPFWARHRARRTFYVITTQRALGHDVDLLGRATLNVYEPAEVAGVKPMIFAKGPDAPGHLLFRAGYVNERLFGLYKVRYYRRWGFYSLQNAREVERILRATLIDPFLEQTYDQKEGG